jgi:hypothetical protein
LKLCYYVTGHGFGHAIRTCQILKELPPNSEFIVRTTAKEAIFREELPTHTFRYLPAEFDCGCVQSDSVTILQTETLNKYREISALNYANLADEIAFLKREEVGCIVSDSGSFPHFAARASGIPSFAVSNFTWHDIYSEYVQSPHDQALLDQMAEEYACATCAWLTPLATPTLENVFPNVEYVPLVCRRGNNITDRLHRLLGAKDTPNCALLYFGVWGLDINWKALERYTNWTFFTYDPAPVPVSNVVKLDRNEWTHADVAASVNAIITKPGYGTVTECIANSVPMIYVPRTTFAEYDALVNGLNRWGGGISMAIGDFAVGAWGDALNATLNVELDSTIFATNGSAVVANKIQDVLNGRS